MKPVILMAFIYVILLFLMAWGFSYLLDKFQSQSITPLKEMMGKRIVFEKDTLLVIDYSILRETVTLKNGTELNIELAKKLPVISK